MSKNEYIEFEKGRITNDLVFSRVMSNKKNCLRLLQAILPELHLTKITKIQTQKVISFEMLVKGVRLDIWAQDSQGRTFDLELQNKNEDGLFKRAEFYSSRLNNRALKIGQSYDKIKDSYVIFLCSFDPFGYNEVRYDIVSVVKSHRDDIIDSGKEIIFLNSKASSFKGLMPDLEAFLQYMNGVVETNSNFISDLERGRNRYINGEEWHDTMIRLKSMQDELREEVREESINKFIVSSRNIFGASDDKILVALEQQYGDSFTKDELEAMMKKAKQ